MTTEVLVKEIRETFKRSEEIWTREESDKRPIRAVFYLAAIRGVEGAPYSNSEIHAQVMSFLEEELDKAFDDLTLEDSTETMRLYSEILLR